jgi:hypothetical protein
MSRKMKYDIDNFEKSLKECNDYIDSKNPLVNNRINEIISRPVYGKLSDDQISSIYNIVQICISQAIKGTDDVESFIKNWDMAAKLGTHDFTTRSEIDNGRSILAAIRQDNTIMDKIKELKSKIVRSCGIPFRILYYSNPLILTFNHNPTSFSRCLTV